MLFRTNFWAIAGGLGGFAAIIALSLAAYIFYQEQWVRPKALSVELLASSQLLNENVKRNGKELKVSFGDEPVENFVIAKVRITNSGGSAITIDDFVEPIKVSHKDARKLFFAEIVNKNPN